MRCYDKGMRPHAVRPIKMLVIEDNLADVLLIREALKSSCPVPVEVTAIEDGEEALAQLRRGVDTDIIVLDLNLPKVNGHSVLKECRKDKPIVVFSSSWNEADATRALALGAREFLRKPIVYDEYVKTVCGIIDRWGNSSDAGELLT